MEDDTKVKANESTWWDKTAAFSAPRECDMREPEHNNRIYKDFTSRTDSCLKVRKLEND